MPRPVHVEPASPRTAWLVTVPMFAVAAAIMIPVALQDHHLLRNIEFAPVFLVLIAIASVATLRLDLRRETIQVTLVDSPLLLALFYLSPLVVFGLRIAVVICTNLFRKTKPVKAWYNIASSAAALAAASLVVHAYGLRGVTPYTWAVLAAAIGANFLVLLAAIAAVLVLVQGNSFVQQLRRSSLMAGGVAAANITVGLVMLLVLDGSTWGSFLLVVLAGLFGLAYRTYAQFVSQHRNLLEMYDIAKALVGTSNDGTLADALLGRVRAALNAESATLWLPAQGRHGEILLSARMDYPGLLDSATTPDQLRERVLSDGEVLLIAGRSGPTALLDLLREQGTRGAIVVPLRSGQAIVGTLEVAGRIGEANQFRPEDCRLLETIAAHVGAAVENSRLVERLRFDAAHDSLTGLANWHRMRSALQEAIAAPILDDVVAVLLFDVVGLRQVNESLGHAAGDRVLIEVANRLRDLAPPGSVVARLGGDEFVIEMRSPRAELAAVEAERIRDRLRDTITIGSLTVDIDAVVGVAVYPDDADEPDLLLQRAEVAAHTVRSGASVQLFHSGLESRSVRRLSLAGDLRRALESDEFQVYFQPKVRLRDRSLVGVECFARWEHPVYGMVPPKDVVAVAEHTGLLGRLTEVVLRAGLERVPDWSGVGEPLSISVNLAARTLTDVGFPGLVRSLLEEYDVSASDLILEVTEEAIVADAEQSLEILNTLREIGVVLSIDDFGTGRASLAYLRKLPIQEIKVDRTFVQGMTTDPRDRAIVQTVVDLSRHLGATAVAEGIESATALGMLEEIGCDLGQGFVFSRPLSPERFEAWLLGQASYARSTRSADRLSQVTFDQELSELEPIAEVRSPAVGSTDGGRRLRVVP